MKLLVVDNSTPRPYNSDSLLLEGLGGTEASVIRVLAALAGRGHDAVILQHCTDTPAVFGNADALTNPDIIVHLRTAAAIPAYAERFPGVPHAVWWHDLFNRENIIDIPVLESFKPLSIFVSKYSRHQAFRALNTLGGSGDYGRTEVVQNPVETYQARRIWDGKPVFLYACSPHKGLERTVEMFKQSNIVGAEMLVANPGYIDSPHVEGVTMLGSLPHRALVERMSRVAAVVSAGVTIPETYGIVFAEAANIGVPVIAHKHGAPIEFLNKGQLIDCNDQAAFTAAMEGAARGQCPSGGTIINSAAVYDKIEKVLTAEVNSAKSSS